ncbi:hypothetical protein IJ076_00655 [Candidatus Saccharibacteria bacterium]|nr:hypothetical protein [Candidatus Saccharibacteria bacterium]
MKIRTNEGIFIQKFDASFIERNLSAPESITNALEYYKIRSASDQFSFGSIITDPEAIKWLEDQDWLADYNKYRSLPISSIEQIIKQWSTNLYEARQKFNAESFAFQENDTEFEENEKCARHVLYSLHVLLGHLLGSYEIRTPKDATEATDTTEGTEESEAAAETISPIKRFFEKLFN